MAAVYTIPAQTIDSYNEPKTIFTLYTGEAYFSYEDVTYNFNNTPLAIFATTPPWGGTMYVLEWASDTTFTNAQSYTYNGQTVYWTYAAARNGVTFNPDLSTKLKNTNTNPNSTGQYTAWLMVYGGYTTPYIATPSEFTATADAIRAKTNSAALIEWEEDEGFANAIAAIQTEVPGLKNALCFSSLSSFTLATSDGSASWNGSMEWTNGVQPWAIWDGSTILTASSGVLYLRGTGNSYVTNEGNTSFYLNGTNISCNGNIETLLDYQTVALGNHPSMDYWCYAHLFQYCTNLISAPSLPAPELEKGCYSHMFNDCTNLTIAPKLPAMTLDEQCYYYMFQGCSSLTSAPALPATSLEYDCYAYMFWNCTSLKSAPALPATTLVDYCYEGMFSDCTNLISAPTLPATTLADYCYSGMFSGCTSLTFAPALPATTLADYCYSQMFEDCTNLTTIPKLPATTLTNYCYYAMFSGCTNLTTIPVLPATTLANYCYYEMFRDSGVAISTSYNATTYPYAFRIPESGTGTTATEALGSMFRDSSGSFTGTPTINTVYYLSKPLPIDFTIDGNATAADILSGKISYANGSRVVGSIASKSSTDLTVSGATVTAPAGYYSAAASKAVASGTQGTPSISVSSGGLITASCTDTTGYITGTTKSATQQMTARTSSDLTASGATVTAPAGYYNAAASKAIASGSAKPPASISGTSATVSTGTNTLTLSKTISVTPTVTAGYVSAGTAGNVSVSLTGSVTTKAAATITPTTSNQTIAAGTYLTGAQTIAGNANLVAGNIKSGVSIFGVTGTFAGDATVYKDAYTSKSVSKSAGTALDAVQGGLTGVSTGRHALFAGGQYSTVSPYYKPTVYAYNDLLTRTDFYMISSSYAVGEYGQATSIKGIALYAGGKSSSAVTGVQAISNTLTVTSATDLSYSRYWIGAASVGDYAIFAGGNTGSTRVTYVECYSSKLTKTSGTALSTKRYRLRGETIGNYAIFAGGYDTAAVAVVEAYSNSLTKTSATSLTTARTDFASTVVGEYALFAGGSASSGSAGLNSVETYSPTLSKGSATVLNVGRSRFTGASNNGFALFAGGYNTNSKVVDSYTTSLVHSVETDLTEGKSWVGGASIDNKIIFAGGNRTSSGTYYSSDIEIYTTQFTLTVSVPANYTYSFNGENPTTVSSATSISKTNSGPISGIVCKAATTRTGQIT